MAASTESSSVLLDQPPPFDCGSPPCSPPIRYHRSGSSPDSLSPLSSLPHHLLTAGYEPRVRTVTMDSEDAERIQVLPDLLYDQEDACCETLRRLNTMRKAGRFCDITIRVSALNITS